MTTTHIASATVQVYQIFIKAPPEAIWQAITSPDWTTKYGYQAPVEHNLRRGWAMLISDLKTLLETGKAFM